MRARANISIRNSSSSFRRSHITSDAPVFRFPFPRWRLGPFYSLTTPIYPFQSSLAFIRSTIMLVRFHRHSLLIPASPALQKSCHFPPLLSSSFCCPVYIVLHLIFTLISLLLSALRELKIACERER